MDTRFEDLVESFEVVCLFFQIRIILLAVTTANVKTEAKTDGEYDEVKDVMIYVPQTVREKKTNDRTKARN